MNELHLFAGIGGGILGGVLRGNTCVCAVEIEPYPRKVLLQRQRDGILPRFPIWDDIRTFDGTPWRGLVDVVCGGFPCQDISQSGKRIGLGGARSGLWKEQLRVVREIRPDYVEVENSPMLSVLGLGTVLGDLAALGYDAEWGVFSASDVGARLVRKRLWIKASLAYAPLRKRLQRENVEHKPLRDMVALDIFSNDRNLLPSPAILRSGDGIPNQLDRARAVGNAQVPAVVRFAFEILK